MAQMTAWVHQYSLRELMDETFDLFKESATTLLLAGAFPTLLVVIYVAVMRLFVIPDNFLSAYTLDAVKEMFTNSRFWLFMGGFTLVSGIAAPMSYLAQCRIAIYRAMGQDLTLGQAFRSLGRPYFSMLTVNVVYGIFSSMVSSVVIFILYILGIIIMGIAFGISSAMSDGAFYETPTPLIIAGIIYFVISVLLWELAFLATTSFFLATPAALVAEKSGPFTAIGRGFSFGVKNLKAYTAALYVVTRVPVAVAALLGIVGGLLVWAIQMAAPTTSMVAVSTVTLLMLGVITTGLMACLHALSYLDGRCRIESLDLALMGRDMGMEADLETILKPAPLRPTAYAPIAQAGPNYLAPPTSAPMPTPPSAAAQYPNYAAAPPQPPVTPQPQVPTAYPDYSAPPQPPMTPQPQAPVTQAYPDYSAPPPPPEPVTTEGDDAR